MLMVMTTMAVLCNDFLLTCPLASVVDFHESCVYLSLCLTLSCSVDFHLFVKIEGIQGKVNVYLPLAL